MFANLIAYNSKGIGKISEASVEYNALNPDDVIQLTIGQKKYCFDSDGKLMSSTEIQTCNTFPDKVSCAQLPPRENVCYPVINSKSE